MSGRICGAAASPCSAPSVSIARLFASVLFGALWTWLGLQSALAIFAAALVVAMLVAAPTLLRRGARA